MAKWVQFAGAINYARGVTEARPSRITGQYTIAKFHFV
jgi:hypothetical protein